MTLPELLVRCVHSDARQSNVAIAKVFGVTRQTVHRWVGDDEIPAGVALRILQLCDDLKISDIAPFVMELDG